MSGRQYKNDLSDIAGILWEQAHPGELKGENINVILQNEEALCDLVIGCRVLFEFLDGHRLWNCNHATSVKYGTILK